MIKEIGEIEVPKEYDDYVSLIYKIAHKYPTNARVDIEDYVSVGMMAFVGAKEAFDPDRGIKLITYAYPAIKNAIEKEYQKNANALSGCSPYFINKGEEHREEINQLNRTTISLSSSRPHLEGLDILKMYAGASKRTKPSLKEAIIASGTTCPQEQAQRKEVITKITSVMEDLQPEEQDIIYRRIFQENTFQEIADAKKVTWKAANYSFHQSMDKLRRLLKNAGLEIYA